MVKQRLSKVIASSGFSSRRAAEAIIFDGKVKVNGKTVRIPQEMVEPIQDVIDIEGTCLVQEPPKVYYALNKPVGYHCTNAVTTRRRVVDLIQVSPAIRLFTVGRLDKDTSGLILVTNDGHFAHRVMHPSGGIKKEYIAKVDQEITHDHLVALSQGCIVEGSTIRPIRVTKIRRATVRIIVQEGKYHELRELLSATGLSVLELKRVKVGELSLGNLPVGGWKSLSRSDIDRLFPKLMVFPKSSLH